jgi:DNA-binding XRE family transcriptional regulator
MAEPAHSASTPSPFAQRVQAFRIAREMTQQELAFAVGTTIAAVRRWEVGTARPSVEEASRLGMLGMNGMSEADTNAGSIARLRGSTARSRADQARSHREAGRRPFAFAGTVSEMVPAPYVLNGPGDQVPFHDTLLRLQMEPAVAESIAPERYRRRLSLVAEVDGEPTSQALLERPRATATSWNSNYGSHGWHRYVGRFPPHLVRALLNHFQAASDDVVLDPFAGSGTTGVECRLLGIPSIGIEISPLSALIARTKSDFPESPFPLLELAMSLTDFYAERRSEFVNAHQGTIPDHAAVLRREGNLVRDFPNYEKWLTPEALLGISLVIEYAADVDSPMRDLLLVALSSKMRSIGNVDVDVVRAEYRKEPRANVDVLRLVRAQLKKMAESVDAIHRSQVDLASAEATQIIEGNILDMTFEPGSIAHVITSPPYGIESLSYLRTHLLSFRCLEPFLNADPYQTGAGVIGSEYLDRVEDPTAQCDNAAASPTFNDFFGSTLDAGVPKLEQRVRMMMRFFDDMGLLIGRLGQWMRPGGCVGFVLGNKRLGERIIPANQIVAELFAAHGFEQREALEHKLKTNNSNSQVPWQERIIQNEYVLILSKR